MDLSEQAKQYLMEWRGDRRRLAEEAGVGYDWINAFLTGRIANPGIRNIEALLHHRDRSGSSASGEAGAAA